MYGADTELVYRDGKWAKWNWKPRKLGAMYCPKWASRIRLEVTDVRIERLHDISEDDAKAEGVDPAQGMTPNEWLRKCPVVKAGRNRVMEAAYGLAYMRLWDQINGRESWDENPFVWVISFRPLSANGGGK